jgi:hypothetical protein
LQIVGGSDHFIFPQILKESARSVSGDVMLWPNSDSSLVGFEILNEALEDLEFGDNSNLISIALDNEGANWEFPEWVTVGGNSSRITLVR